MNRVAAVGSALLAAFYFVANGLPVLRNLDTLPALSSAQPFGLLILPQLVWTWFLAGLGRRAALVTLLAAVAPQATYSWIQTWPTFSLLSIDSIFYLFSGVIQPLAYAWFLLAVFRKSSERGASLILWTLTTLQAMSAILSTITAMLALGASLATYWTIFAGPAILICYWGSQSLFFRGRRKLDMQKIARYKS